MSNLILKILAYVPLYITDFGSLLSGPKRFIAQKNITAEDALGRSLVFLGISIFVEVVMSISQQSPGTNLWTFGVQQAIMSLLAVSLFAIALRIAWRLVGGRAPVRSFFATYAYFFGVGTVLLTFFSLLSLGAMKVYAPGLYAQWIESARMKQPMHDLSGSSLLAVILIAVAGSSVSYVWFIVTWGAYRELNGLNKGRSFLALIIMHVFLIGIVYVMFYVAVAM